MVHQNHLFFIVCDRFTSNDWFVIEEKTLKNISHFLTACDDEGNSEVSDEIRKCYQYTGFGKQPWMTLCLLSPRGIYRKNNSKKGYVVCKDCGYHARNSKYPCHSIANGFFFGTPPFEITSLWESELAVLTPSSCYGYCFTYNGGENMKLKGTLGYYKVKPEGIARVAAVAKSLGRYFNREVVFILNGKMTSKQKKRALERSKIRPEKMVQVIKWCIKNNNEWCNINIDEIEENIQNCKPIIVDHSEEVESGADKATEDEESFSVYFPDGSMTEVYGGKQSACDFRQVVAEAQNKGFEAEIVSSLSREFVKDYLDNTFVSSCILQMPFGRGGPRKCRYGDDGLTNSYWGMNEYAQHLSLISQPAFQRPLFVLKLFNIKIRANILRTATQQLYSNISLWNLRDTINSQDFQIAAKAHGRGLRAGSAASQQLVRSIDSMNKSLPHSNGAVNRARMFMESLQQQFGLGGIFLTVTPDDENSFLVVAYSQTNMSGKPIDVAELSSDVLKSNAKKRSELRLQFPGITALNFQYIVDIVIEEVIGWSIKNNQPTDRPGLFGKPKAYGGAVEEQGRTSLHVHFIVWLEGWDCYLESVTDPGKPHEHKKVAESEICKVVNNSLSTKLFDFNIDNYNYFAKKSFQHICDEPDERKRKRPEVMGDQQLRNLRHKDCHLNNLSLAKCPNCKTTWTNEDLVLDYLVNGKQLNNIVHYPDKSKYLDQICFEYTKPLYDGSVNKACIHARYNSHRSTHCKSCFKKKAKGVTNMPFADECRMHLPALKKKKTVVEKVPLTTKGDNNIPWFKWTGETFEKAIVQVTPKRGEYDVFQNTCCWPISESKIGGNSNGKVITPGPIGMYTFKYPTKKTQTDDSEPYSPVIESLSTALQGKPTHETDRSESLRLVVRAGFVHNKTNIVGCSMASYLTRQNSRFLFSHQFAWVPLLDLLQALQTGSVQRTTIKSHKGHRYANVPALDYLCRPKDLQYLSPYEFFTTFETIKIEGKKQKNKNFLHFEDTQYFSHPSYITTQSREKKKLSALRERHMLHLPWILQYKFPDTACFKANIINCSDAKICQEMETYASLVLCLCHSYYCHDDIKLNGSYVKKLRDVYRAGKLIKYEQFLQNIQDSRGNYGRVKPTHDDLQMCTNPYKTENPDDDNELDNDEEEIVYLQGYELENFLNEIDVEVDSATNIHNLQRGESTIDFIPPTFDCSKIKKKGAYKCGYQNLCGITKRTPAQDGICGSFVKPQFDINNIIELQQDPTMNVPVRATPNRHELVEILFSRKGSVTKLIKFGSTEVHKVFPEPNGSARSIIQWGKFAGFDTNQQRAFEIFTSSFVLSFYNEASQEVGGNCPTGHNTRNKSFNIAKLELLKLAGRVSTTANRFPSNIDRQNLICFLHGPGGSGKSAIMNILLLYAQNFCEYIGDIFSAHTIVVTAMSGVAATLIKGQTTHSALYLNSNTTNISRDEIERWKCTQLLIIDEISFASRYDIEKIEMHLKILKDNYTRFYGGVDVIFCGDFRQLEPCSGAPTIYCEEFFQFHSMVNCYIELHGMHRFKDDMEWGRLLMRFRNGELTEQDVDKINTRVIKGSANLPDDMRYATYNNKDRSSINIGLFEGYCTEQQESNQGISVPLTDCVVIFASDLRVRNGARTFVSKDNAWDAWFFENCGEGDIDPAGFSGRFDPALMLYYHRPMIVNSNINVSDGIANGTRAYASQVHLKFGEQVSSVVVGGVTLPAIRTAQVERITLMREVEKGKPPSFFDVSAIQHGFTAKLPIPSSLQIGGRRGQNIERLGMTGVQFPLMCNNATTGHKLQGASVETLFVHTWASAKNWVYVVLSRVRQMNGLFLRTKMNKKDLPKYNAIPEELLNMIQYFRNNKMKSGLSQVEYDNIFNNIYND